LLCRKWHIEETNGTSGSKEFEQARCLATTGRKAILDSRPRIGRMLLPAERMLRDSTPFTFSDVEMGEVMTGTRESASVLDAYYFRLALAVADADRPSRRHACNSSPGRVFSYCASLIV
jgi:hypothetical protein